MLKKIISGGQTGVDRAALDVAIKFEILHREWISQGNEAEDGPIPGKYQLKETSSPGHKNRIEQNIMDSDGTLIISHGELTGGLELTQSFAKKHKKPCLRIELNSISAFRAANEINDWIQSNSIEVLNVTGHSASKAPEIYKIVSDILEAAIYLNIMKTDMPNHTHSTNAARGKTGWIGLPRTVEEVINIIISEMYLKDKSILANMRYEDLNSLQNTLGLFIRDNYGLWGTNTELLESCRIVSGEKNMDANKASSVIISEIWKKLQKTHKLRVIK